MSRIHEALQRASRERKPPRDEDAAGPVPPDSTPASMQSLLTLIGVDLNRATRRTWTPNRLSLPTLNDRSECVEQFRSLRSRIYEFHQQKPLKTIVVSSGMSMEGKTFVAANLAIALARNKNQQVLLIDGDLRRPALHEILGTSAAPGLTEFLTGTAELEEIIQCHDATDTPETQGSPALTNLCFIPAGQCSDSSAELLSSAHLETILVALSAPFSWIIIDSPPALAFADAIDLARAADSVLLVARSASTPFDIAQRVQSAFGGARILGFVLNAVKNPPRSGSYYGYYRR